MEKERMFDNDSFQEEITNASEAKASYTYYAHNLTAFRRELADEGLSYEDIEKEVRQGWINLLNSCKRVGYSNSHLKHIEESYKAKNKED